MLNLEPDMFGAVGDGVTDDHVAFQQAFDFLKDAGGGRLSLTGRRTYYLGQVGPNDAAVACTDLANVTIEGNGAKLLVASTTVVMSALDSPAFLKLTNATNVRMNGLRFKDNGFSFTDQWKGAIAVQLVASGSSGESSGIVVDDCLAENCLTLLTVTGVTTHRLTGISVRDCRVTNCFYGISCQNNGDGLRVSGLRCINVRRAYFPYGVTDHDVELWISHDGTVLGQDTACLIKCYDRDTTGIRLRARFIVTYDPLNPAPDPLMLRTYKNGVTLEHQRLAGIGAGTISDIDIGLEIDKPGAMYPVRFRSYLDSPVLPTSEQAITSNKWDRIMIGGNLATTQQETITFGALTAQGAEGRLILVPSVMRHQSRQPHYPGFVVSTVHGREFRTVKGNLSTQQITIPFKAFETYPFEIIVTTWAQDNLSAVAAAKRTYCRDLLFCQNPTVAGPISVTDQQNLVNKYWNGAVTVTYGPSASGDDLVVTLSGYTGTNGLARVEVEYISRGP